MILAGEKRPEETAARNELATARRTLFGRERGQIVRLADQRLDVGSLYRYSERPVKVAEHLPPVHLAFLDLVEVGLHVRRELDVEDIGEALHHHSLDLLPEMGREEAPLLESRVAAIDDGRHDRRVSRRPADAEPLQLFYQARL